MKKISRKRQRGVVLLVVLSLLTLFTLLMVTFIIVAGQYRRPERWRRSATDVYHRCDPEPPGYTPPSFDMYGGDGFTGTISVVGDVTDASDLAT